MAQVVSTRGILRYVRDCPNSSPAQAGNYLEIQCQNITDGHKPVKQCIRKILMDDTDIDIAPRKIQEFISRKGQIGLARIFTFLFPRARVSSANMSYTKMSKKIPNEEVEEKNTKNKSVMKGCPSLDLNESLEETDLQLNPFPNSTDATKLNPPKVSETQPEVREEEPEYGCNFCPKKFSNKQALGGHQNAHKIEKVGQKRARQGQEANFGYTGNGINSFSFPISFDQVPKMIKSAHYPQYIDHQMHAYEYPGSSFPMSHESGVAQPFMGFGGFCTIPKQPPKPQMHARNYPGSMFPMSHEYGVPHPFMELGNVGTSVENPPSMSFGRRTGPMGQGASTSKGRSTAVAKNYEADHHRHINNTEIKHPEDDLDLSLKL